MRLLFSICFCFLFLFPRAENYFLQYSPNDFFALEAFNEVIDLKHVDVDLIEAGVYFICNNYRAKKGRPTLVYQSNLSDAAYLHSQQMQIYDFFDHVNKKNKELATLEDRINRVNYFNFETLAENIFYGYIDLENVATYRELAMGIVKNFAESKGHRENLLATDVDEIGCGIAFEKGVKDGYWYFYFTQDFGMRN